MENGSFDVILNVSFCRGLSSKGLLKGLLLQPSLLYKLRKKDFSLKSSWTQKFCGKMRSIWDSRGMTRAILQRTHCLCRAPAKSDIATLLSHPSTPAIGGTRYSFIQPSAWICWQIPFFAVLVGLGGNPWYSMWDSFRVWRYSKQYRYRCSASLESYG